jgi:PleD family two-component response regulator
LFQTQCVAYTICYFTNQIFSDLFPPQVLSFGILTTDDDKDTSSSLKIVLDETGLFQVDAFDDPTQALTSFKSNGYDVVILDVPGMALSFIQK